MKKCCASGLTARRAKYDEPARYDFQDAAMAGDNTEAAVRAFVQALNSGTPGDAKADLRVFKGRPQANVVASYGAEFAKALEEFDAFIPQLEAKLTPRDLVILSADHGNDPTYRGTDHTREYVPFIAYSKGTQARALGNRKTFADIGQTVVH